MKYKAIIWDLDGTLLDTLQDLYLAVNYSLSHHGMPECTHDEIKRFLGNGVRRLIALSVPEGETNSQFEGVFTMFREYYVKHCKEYTRPYPGIQEMLRVLRLRGYRMAIVSNKLQSGVTELYEAHFKDTIDVAVGESTGVRRKPSPDMVEQVLGMLGVSSSEAVYIGDSEVDVDTARNASLPCISVLWGFRDKDTLTSCGATQLAATPADILDLV